MKIKTLEDKYLLVENTQYGPESDIKMDTFGWTGSLKEAKWFKRNRGHLSLLTPAV